MIMIGSRTQIGSCCRGTQGDADSRRGTRSCYLVCVDATAEQLSCAERSHAAAELSGGPDDSAALPCAALAFPVRAVGYFGSCATDMLAVVARCRSAAPAAAPLGLSSAHSASWCYCPRQTALARTCPGATHAWCG